ncbi:MAG TPA: hypothetical protein VL860_03015, partial [Planctomycetota bacterium]|nr:hypothetical protein [Planctomycetota bacterium]
KEFIDTWIREHTPASTSVSDVPPPPIPGKQPDPPANPPDHPTGPEPVSTDPVEILKATNAVCANAQKKLDKQDLVMARRLLAEHTQKYGLSPQTRQASDLLTDVNQRIDTFLDTCLNNVRDKSKTNDFAAAATWGSKAIGLDPVAKQTLEVQVILGNNDILMQTPCQQALADGREKINSGDFQGAQKLIAGVLARANGTVWTPKLRSLHLEALYGDRISKKLNAVLTDAASKDTPFVMVARGTDQGYSVTKLTGFKVTSVEGPVMKISNFNDLTMDNWIKKIPNLDAIDHLALGIFMDLAGLPTVATSEIVKASRDRSTAADAIAYQTSHNMISKFRFYDFQDWKQQLDWEVQSGSWAFQDQRFECQSPDIGEVNLNPKFVVISKGLNLSWVAYPKSDKSGFIVDVYQDATHRIGVTVEAGKVRLDLQAGDANPQSVEGSLTPVANKPIEFAVQVRGDDVMLVLPAPSKPLTGKLAGVSELRGKLRIQILDATTAFDDILIQN